MDHVGLPRAHVVGISRGAVSAYAMATRHEARVLSLSLLVPVAPYVDQLHESTPGPDLDGEDELVAYVGRQLFSDSFIREQPDRVRAFVLEPPGSVVRVLREVEEVLPPTEVPSVPTRIVSATGDQVVARSNAQALAAAIPQATWAELPGEHLALYEDPAAWARQISAFVAEVDAAA
jgi:pimeloyl-ACP methyl ester carboxylesterase